MHINIIYWSTSEQSIEDFTEEDAIRYAHHMDADYCEIVESGKNGNGKKYKEYKEAFKKSGNPTDVKSIVEELKEKAEKENFYFAKGSLYIMLGCMMNGAVCEYSTFYNIDRTENDAPDEKTDWFYKLVDYHL